MWKCYITTSIYVGQFFITGTNDEAIDGWRKELVTSRSNVAQELAYWDGKNFKINEKFVGEEASRKKRKMMIKRIDTYMGIGDLVLQSNTIAETEAILE
jgi:hypothetical protein